MLLRELLFLEVEIKRDAGEAGLARGFQGRFPDAASDVDAAFAESAASAPLFGPSHLDEPSVAALEPAPNADGVPAPAS